MSQWITQWLAPDMFGGIGRKPVGRMFRVVSDSKASTSTFCGRSTGKLCLYSEPRDATSVTMKLLAALQ